MEINPFCYEGPITDWIRKYRTVSFLENSNDQHSSSLTIFIGLYNSASFWQDIVANLERQTNKDVSLPMQRILVRNGLKLLRRVGLGRARPDLDFEWRKRK